MRYTIENPLLRAAVCARGAELGSLYAKERRHEYLWQGDPAVWARRAPLLFPIVGRLKGDAYTRAGKRYALAKHGFARDADFEVTQQGPESLCFALEDASGARAGFPFPHRLCVCYTLGGSTLHIHHTVENLGADPLYFSIGAHPGFACAMGDILAFEREEPLAPYRLTDQMLLSAAPDAAIGHGQLMITPTLFERDALIFVQLASRSVRLRRQAGQGDVLVAWGDAPCLGVWAKPGAPYVCIEPWWGIDDGEDANGAIERKPHIQCLPPGGTARFPLSITVEV